MLYMSESNLRAAWSCPGWKFNVHILVGEFKPEAGKVFEGAINNFAKARKCAAKDDATILGIINLPEGFEQKRLSFTRPFCAAV